MSFWSVLKKDIKLLLKDRPQMAVLFLMPLAFILPISFALGPNGYGNGVRQPATSCQSSISMAAPAAPS